MKAKKKETLIDRMRKGCKRYYRDSYGPKDGRQKSDHLCVPQKGDSTKVKKCVLRNCERKKCKEEGRRFRP